MIYLIEQKDIIDQRAAARKLLLLGLKAEYGIQKLPQMAKMEKGKPYFPGFPEIRFNYSHSRQGILCGISVNEIGVDIERKVTLKESFVRRVCHERERRLLETVSDLESREWLLSRMWTAKESYLKCTGTGIRVDLNKLDFSDCLNGGRFLEEYRMSFRAGREYMAAICEKCGEQDETLAWRQVCKEELVD